MRDLHRLAHHAEIYPVELRVLRRGRTGHRRRCGSAVPHPLHAPRRRQGGHLAPAPAREGAEPAVPAARWAAPERDNVIDGYINRERGGRLRRRHLAEVLHTPSRAVDEPRRSAAYLAGIDRRGAGLGRVLPVRRQHRARATQRRVATSPSPAAPSATTR